MRSPSCRGLAFVASAALVFACGSPGASSSNGGGSAASSGGGSSGSGAGNGSSGTSGGGSGSGGGASSGGGDEDGGATSSGSSSGGTAPVGDGGPGSVTLPGGGNYTATAPVDFGPNVLIFDPTMGDATIQSKIDTVFNAQQTNQFGSQRYAYLFKPGTYNLDVQLGFYMHVLGLGTTPDAVSITGAVRSMAKWAQGNATQNFWRFAENLAVTPTAAINTNDVWAVSQATVLRRVHILGGANLFDPEGGPNEWASGGFIADSKIDGTVVPGSQQQFLTRNVTMGDWVGGVWNMVFVGNQGNPTGDWPTSPYTFVAQTPGIREKPYLTIDGSGNYAVVAPILAHNTTGISWASGPAPSTTTPVSKFYIAHSGTDTADTINAALGAGANLILTPGVYHVKSALQVTRPGTIVLGLGLATLIPDTGTPALTVADADSVTVAGILFDAGALSSPTLFQIGGASANSTLNHTLSPTALFDISCRVGGVTAGLAQSCGTINSNDVIIDNAWMWRADHGNGVGWTVNVANNGLIVNGANVSAYGLFVEHFEQYQTLWNGNGGKVYFYQSEIPYDVPSNSVWTPTGSAANGYASFKVADDVTTFDGRGFGVYCYFDNDVVLDNAILQPSASGVTLQHGVTQWFKNAPNSAINHIVNGTGLAVNASNSGATTAD